MKSMLANMKCIASAFLLCVSLFLLSCNDDSEESKISVQFETVSATVEEDSQIEVIASLSKPATQTEYITFSVTSSVAEFGNDFGIDNLIFPTDKFTVVVPKDSASATFTFDALADFENESPEAVVFTIAEISDGLILGNSVSTTITITNVEDYPNDNRALYFDGIDDYVDLGNIYDNVALPITISAWVWLDPTAPAGSIPIFDSQDGLAVYNGFNLLTSNTSNIGIQYGDGQGENNSIYRRAKSATFNSINGRWVNFTGVMRSATDMDLYFNGVDVGGTYAGTSNLPMNSNSSSEVAKIGLLTQNGVTSRFKGKIDELRIWNRSLTQTEIQSVIFTKIDKTHPNLIGYWNFDEPTGDALLDQSNNKFNGVLKGNPSRVLSEVPVE